MSEPWLQPKVLIGQLVELRPLSRDHTTDLQRVILNSQLADLWYTSVPRPEEVADYIDRALADRDKGIAMPYIVRLRSSGAAVGCTRYCNADASAPNLEIGYTWYSPKVQRTGVNTECKYLMLEHAFESLDCIAVYFRTHFMNRRSRAAIERLGAKQDGIIRNHQRLPDGSYRDTVVYSIIDNEWPAVRNRLQGLMDNEYT
ncbi:GNAT family N-acetyltransferase [Salinispirillum sp. LH 10-3-1]|uniref:GNAT family N-acetyltransferase n=1 Tax=Salinispirillum sp. LH 10-3-1 TaxID=2952525 RepID=A0AB38YDG4_9GAMM